ncbi:MAG: YggS family pyridoxal phosphate-dependent enzyme [Saprospiraceae bacterium]|nr:YggS family pyridoxal phosphate-dependent enzyme [Saprospiraceae bacterium]
MYDQIASELKACHVKLIAVSKTKSPEQILVLYEKGQRAFGENKVQELVSKYEILPKDIEWHLIGHLQKNKVKYIAPFVKMIHSVDNAELLQIIEKEAIKNNRTIDILLQFYIATEDTKFGLDIKEAIELLKIFNFSNHENIRICGVMGMASFTDDTNNVRQEFKNLKNIFSELKSRYFSDKAYFKEISMGMSGDYRIAIEEGATTVRIGSLIFGGR